MLNQIIYTKCRPHRDIKNHGQVISEDGNGYYSMSRQLFSDVPEKDIEKLCRVIAVMNGSNKDSRTVPTPPPGLLHSYEYQKISEDTFLFSYEEARPFCEVPRKNNIGHRMGTHIKQCLTGKILGYPWEWFGADAWNAHKRSENDYYLDEDPDAAPDFLPQVSDRPTGGYLNPFFIRQFVEDGRTEAVKAGLWFLLKEFEKPEGERKVLLIKDTPENVELWIAAMEFGLSEAMAREITFTTNRTNLAKAMDAVLFYYTEESRRSPGQMNSRTHQVRHPYCMITGYHPQDRDSAPLRQMPASNYAIIDGETKTSGIQPDESIHKPYFSQVVEYNGVIWKFCNTVLAGISLTEAAGKLPELFDAYQYLLVRNPDNWEYTEVISKLTVLKEIKKVYGNVLKGGLLKECLNIYPSAAGKDKGRGFPLLQLILEMIFMLKESGAYELPGISREKEIAFFQMADQKLKDEADSQMISIFYRDMGRWAASLGTISESASLFKFKDSFLKEEDKEMAKKLSRDFAGKRIMIKREWLEGRSFAEISCHAADFYDAAIHQMMLCLFEIRDRDLMYHYIQIYVSNVLDSTRKCSLAETLLSLCAATIYANTDTGKPISFMRDLRGALEMELREQLVKYYRFHLFSQVRRNRDWNEQVKSRLLSMLEEVGEKEKASGKEGIFGRLFKRGRKNE